MELFQKHGFAVDNYQTARDQVCVSELIPMHKAIPPGASGRS
jgi:hypothetical protein